MSKNILLIMAFGFLGGLVGSIILTSPALYAALKDGKYSTVQLYNNDAKRIGFIGTHDDEQGVLFLFDENGGTTHQLESYSEGLEKGQSLMGLHDKSNHLRFLMRLHGTNDSPTVVMKDNRGADTIVFGLDGETQKPYFKYKDDKGIMRDLINN